MAKIVVGISGGVDSSVAAYLLKEQGHEVAGLFMKNWEDDDNGACGVEQDASDAEAVCHNLGIELHKINFAAEYWDNVFEHFLAELKAGRTPNPDILCNREIKFKYFLDFAKSLGADYIATGHYAGTIATEDGINLVKGLDTNKDQSYFLYGLNQMQLKSAIFPLAKLCKPKIRAIAKEQNLITYDKKDSTGICFIGPKKFRSFVQKYMPIEPGKIISEHGDVLGEHQGLMYYTIGQRQGLNIGGVAGHPEEPWYVVDKRLNDNELIIAQGNNNPLLYKEGLFINDIHWINKEQALPLKCQAKIRYRQQDQECLISHDVKSSKYLVAFDSAQRGVTPGQSVVFYQNDICLGGGIIVQSTQLIPNTSRELVYGRP